MEEDTAVQDDSMQDDPMNGKDGPRDLRIVRYIARAYDITEDQDERPRHNLPRLENLDSPPDMDLSIMDELRGLLYGLMEDPQQRSDRYRFGFQRPETQSLMRSMLLAMEELRDNRERAYYAVLYRMLGIPPPDPMPAGSLRADWEELRVVIIHRKPPFLRVLQHC